MKRNSWSLCFWLVGIFTFFASCSGPNREQLPSNARTFLHKYFENVDIISIEQDVDREYSVYLENGIEISFERKGNWTEIKAKKKPLPESLFQILPQQISSFVHDNYPEQTIRKIERKTYGYRISLNKPNDVELKFTRQGVFINED